MTPGSEDQQFRDERERDRPICPAPAVGATPEELAQPADPEGQRLLQTTDPEEWARAFRSRFLYDLGPGHERQHVLVPDMGDLIAWFANAIGAGRSAEQQPASESIIVRAARELTDAIGVSADAADVVAAARVLLEEEYSGKDVERILLPHGIANGALVRHLSNMLVASGRPVRGAAIPANAVILTPDETQTMLDQAVRGWFNDMAVAS